MTINKFNYEAFALDYLEGNLTAELAAEMERFLETHPAIESELSGMMEFVILEADEAIVYEPKAALLKKERVVWLNKKWIRPLLAAASIVLLLTTYFVGYNAGVNNGGEQVVVENGNDNFNSNSNSNSNNENLVVVDDSSSKKNLVANKEIEEQSFKKEQQQIGKEAVLIKKELITTKNNIAKVVYQPIERPSIVEEQVPTIVNEVEARNHPTDKIPASTPNPLPLTTNPVAVVEIESIMATAVTRLAATNLLNTKLVSTQAGLNDLTQVLAGDLPIDQEQLAQQLRPKRKFKDFLGKFPVNNLREALIPSYYREETTGQ